MYATLNLSGYRGLKPFHIEGLGRVNLLVGKNNSGKTSILECVELLRTAGSPTVLSSIVRWRGEWGQPDDRRPPTINVTHLFPNHDLGNKICIEATNGDVTDSQRWRNKITIRVRPRSRKEIAEWPYDLLNEEENSLLEVVSSNPKRRYGAGVTSEGQTSLHRRPIRSETDPEKPVCFIRTDGLTAWDAVRLFDELVLTENEENVCEALRIIDPSLERIAAVSNASAMRSRVGPGGLFVKLKNVEDRIPIGSAGDGMWRMFGLAVALANAKGGVLLVDEIDTGLHFTVMKQMWQMVTERANALRVQVFATTHSRDCYESLAEMLQSAPSSPEVAIHRVEPERNKTVVFHNDEIIAAARRGLEVR